jgi:hypothetical protein
MFRPKAAVMPARGFAGEGVEEIINLLNSTLAAALIAGGVSSLGWFS